MPESDVLWTKCGDQSSAVHLRLNMYMLIGMWVPVYVSYLFFCFHISPFILIFFFFFFGDVSLNAFQSFFGYLHQNMWETSTPV